MHISSRRSVVLLALTCLTATWDAVGSDLSPAHYTVAKWTEKDGLPSSQIRFIVQTRDGFLWLGTAAGLVRFDGVTFTSSFPGLPEGEVTGLCATRDGSLWIGLDDGRLTRMRNGVVVANFGPDKALAGSRLTSMIEDRNGTIWAGGRGGLFRFRNNTWEPMGPTRDFSVMSLYEDRQGDILVGSIAPVVLVLKPGAETFDELPSPPRIHGIDEDPSGAIWIADSQRGFRLFRGSARPGMPTLGSEREYGFKLIHDHAGDLWVATQGRGLMRIGTRGTTPVVERFTTNDGLAHNVINALLEDREGNLWVGTTGGLSRLSEGSFTSLITSGGQNTSLTAASDGSVWVATADGLLRFRNGVRTVFTHAEGLPSDYTTVVAEDSHGAIWVGTDRGIARFADGRFAPVIFPHAFPRGLIRAIAIAPDGTLVFCDIDRGLFELRDGVVTQLGGALLHKLGHFAITDGRGAVWVGFQDGGVARLSDGVTQVFGPEDGLGAGRVNALFELDGTIWVGTNGGLSRFDGDRFVTLALQRLPGRNLSSVVADDEGYLWLGVTSGIVRLGIDEFNKSVADGSHQVDFRLYDSSDGAPGSPVVVLGRGAVRARDGAVWFATGDGIAVIDPKHLPAKRVPPAVLIENIAADQQSMPPEADLRLGPHMSRLQIDYTALTLSASWVRFRYSLQGFDQSWVDAGTSRHALYTNLRPGQYRFRISASNKDGVWSEPAQWAFSIAPSLYQTNAFYSGAAIAGLLMLWAVWQLRLRAMQRRFVLVFSERARLAREIHDTLLQSLVGVALQLDTISERAAAPDVMRQHLARARKQVEGFIREARQSIWNLRSPALAVHDLATALRESCHTLTAGLDLRFELVVLGKPRPFAPRVEEQLLRIGQEAVSNAVRHANATIVCLELRYTEDAVVLRVSDDGCGFDPDVAATIRNHWGLKSMQERAHQIGGHLTVSTRPGAGTVLETTAPVAAA